MFDFKFDWDPNVAVGVKEIDIQHQELFRIGRDIEQLIITGAAGKTPEDIINQLCALREYVTYHFYTEEKILEVFQTPEVYRRHQEQHDAFKARINKIDCIELIKNPVAGFKEIKQMLQQWLFTHILHTDKMDFMGIHVE